MGHQAISSLKVGQHVTAYDPTTGKAGAQTVEHVFLDHDTDLLDVTLQISVPDNAASAAQQKADTAHSGIAASPRAETVHTTDTHPWLTADHGWLPANFLRVGEPVVRADGSTATVVAVRAVPGAADMWDLTVANVHTFAVGAGAYVVHNVDCTGGQKTYQTYTVTNEQTGEVYSGRTSGYGTPEENIQRRFDAGHERAGNGWGEPVRLRCARSASR